MDIIQVAVDTLEEDNQEAFDNLKGHTIIKGDSILEVVAKILEVDIPEVDTVTAAEGIVAIIEDIMAIADISQIHLVGFVDIMVVKEQQ